MRIVLACAGGASTGMLVKRMAEAAAENGTRADISACAVSELEAEAAGADVILLGPQVAYQLRDVKRRFPGVPVLVINMMDYGMMNGRKVLKDLLNAMGR